MEALDHDNMKVMIGWMESESKDREDGGKCDTDKFYIVYW